MKNARIIWKLVVAAEKAIIVEGARSNDIPRKQNLSREAKPCLRLCHAVPENERVAKEARPKHSVNFGIDGCGAMTARHTRAGGAGRFSSIPFGFPALA